MKVSVFVWTVATFAANPSFGSHCTEWEESVIGQLDTELVNEASGISYSRVADLIYTINDSGDGPNLYVSDVAAGHTKKVVVEGLEPVDTEDLTVGPCGEENCVYISDVGDNARMRSSVQIAIVPDRADLGESVSARVVTLRYPDRAHDAEGVAMHPNGDLYVLTKEIDYVNNRAASAQLYRVGRETLHSASEAELEWVAELELPYLLYMFNLWGRLVTAFDISPDGKRALILTYKTAMEVQLDLAEQVVPVRRWTEEHYQLIPTRPLPQQEAAAYHPTRDAFIYTTEFHSEFGSAPLIESRCRERGTSPSTPQVEVAL